MTGVTSVTGELMSRCHDRLEAVTGRDHAGTPYEVGGPRVTPVTRAGSPI